MATVPAVAYLGDRYQWIEELGEWAPPPFHDVRTFQDGQPGEIAQNGVLDENDVPINNYKDGWDGGAGQSTYTDEVLYKGRQVCRCFVPEGKYGSMAFGGYVDKDVDAVLHQSVWVQVTCMIPSSFDFSTKEVSDAMKFLRMSLKGVDYANSPDEDGNTVYKGRNHADIYLMHPDFSNNVFKYTFENHTNGELGHEKHNSKREFLNRSTWDIPKDEWFNVQFMVTHDYHRDNLADSKCVLRVWVEDDLVSELKGTDEVWHSMLDARDRVAYTNFITFYNGYAGKDLHLYVAEYEHTSVTPTYTDAHGNPKLPPRI